MILLIAIVITASLAVIIARHARDESRRKKMEAAFNSMAAQFEFFISRKEVQGNRVIALDEKSNRLLYCSGINGKHEGYLVHMNELR